MAAAARQSSKTALAARQAALLPQLAALPCPRVEMPSEWPALQALQVPPAVEKLSRWRRPLVLIGNEVQTGSGLLPAVPCPLGISRPEAGRGVTNTGGNWTNSGGTWTKSTTKPIRGNIFQIGSFLRLA